MKTMKEWESKGGDFGQYVNPKDEIDDDLYFYFLEVLPPQTMRRYGFLVGEPASHNTKGEAVYDSFYETYEERFFYGGTKTVKEFTDPNNEKYFL